MRQRGLLVRSAVAGVIAVIVADALQRRGWSYLEALAAIVAAAFVLGPLADLVRRSRRRRREPRGGKELERSAGGTGRDG